MRICSFNVENFFQRPRAMNQATWSEGRPVLAAHAELNTLIDEAVYTPAAKARMVELLEVLGLTRSDSAEMAVLRQIRGRLVRRPQGGGVEVDRRRARRLGGLGRPHHRAGHCRGDR